MRSRAAAWSVAARALAVVALVGLVAPVAWAPPLAEAAPTVPFVPRQTLNDNGAIALIGNNLLTDSAHVSATEVDDVPANNDSAAAVTVLAVPPAPAPPPTPEPGLPPTGAEIAATVQVSLLLLLTGATLVFAAFRGRDFRRPCEDEVRRGRYHRR